MNMDNTTSPIRTIARKVIFFIDPLVDRAISRYLAKRNPAAPPREFSEEEKREIKQRIGKLAELPLPTDKALKRVEIIVLKYKDPEVETICASRIIENTEWPYKLNFFDNRPGTKNMSKIWNQLVRESTCDYVLIIDSDAFVPKLTPCWLTRMMTVLLSEDACVAVLPKVTRTSCDQQRAQVARDGAPELLAETFAAQCVLYKKDTFDKLGYFDEEFLMYGQDVEWSHRLLTSQWKAYILPDVLVEHLGHYSNKKAVIKNEYDKEAEGVYAHLLLEEKNA